VSEVALSMLQVNGKQLEMGFWPAASANGTIVLLHEALGSVSYWKDFPEKLALVTGYDVVAYSRAGHGESEGPVEPRNVEYYQNQIDIVLPAVLGHFHVEQPVLYGHSEGAAIAFLYAARHHSVVAECPIVMQEERTVQTIVELAAAYSTSDMSRRLGRYHRDADAVFHAWMQSNRGTVFKDFPMHQYLVQVTCPVLVLQGSRDEFGSVRQFESLQQSLPLAQHAVLEAGHLLHREQPDLVVEHVQAFLSTTSPAGSGANNHQGMKENS
jgi:pimeloyl-ACP methyl ester carboxylesterase